MHNKISLIIPSTRSDCLDLSLRSALDQDPPFFEIIISDNNLECINHQKKFKKYSNVKYFKTPKYLDLVDNWNFAFNKINGDWVLLLTDKDLIVKSFTKIINRYIDEDKNCLIFSWNQGVFKNVHRTSLTVNEFSKQKKIFSSGKTIKKIFEYSGFYNKDQIPFLPRAIYSRSIINRFKKINGNFFLRPEPMLSSALASLSLTKYYCVIDYPLVIKGFHVKNSAGNYLKRSKSFLKMHYNIKIFKSPIKSLLCFPSWSFETLINFKERFPQLFGIYNLNKFSFYLNCNKALYTDYNNSNLLIFRELRAEIIKKIRSQPIILRVYVIVNIFTYVIFKKFKIFGYIASLFSKIFFIKRKKSVILKEGLKFSDCVDLIEREINIKD